MPEPNPGGRPRADIDLEEFEKLAALACTQADIAGWFGLHLSTVEKRLASDELIETKYGMITLRELLERGQARGRVSVRRKQMQMLEEGNATMAVWLGKNILGQRDQLGISGPDGGPIDLITRVLRRAEEEAE